jgi:hypothetical protein
MTGKGIGFVGSELGDAIESTVVGARWEMIKTKIR